MRRFVALAVAVAAGGFTTTANAQKPKDPGAFTKQWSTTPVQVTPEQAQAAALPRLSGSIAPMCAIDENGNCIGASEDAYDTEGDTGSYEAYAYGQSCWYATDAVEWGAWPYQQRLSNDTYWCVSGRGVLTYRTSHVRLGKTVCTASGAYIWKIYGGVGYPGVILQFGGSWQCGIPYIGPWNRDHWAKDVHDAIGQVYFLDYA